MEDWMKSEINRMEVEQFEKSGTEDDFNTWKLKKYVDEKITQLLFIIIGSAIGIIVAIKFL